MSDLKNETSGDPIQTVTKTEIKTAASVVNSTKNNQNDNNIKKNAPNAPSQNILDNAQPLDPKSFPNQPNSGSKLIPTTIVNSQHLINSYGIVIKYNTINKKLSITLPGYTGTPDNADNVAITQILSLAVLNGLNPGQVLSYLEVIGDRNQYNPIADWICNKPWDKKDRLESFYETLTERQNYPPPVKKYLLYRWLLSAVAAALKPEGFKARGVLTLQGPQSIGKTSWISALVPDQILRDKNVKLDHHLDAGNKDSLLTAITHWIVEIGELDSSFKKDIARLKGFLTSDHDKVRRPYGRANSEYPRRTVFCATVNEENFLVDSTGNTRWWTIRVDKVDYKHKIDMQQLFAQLVEDFYRGEQWWLTPHEEEMLEMLNAGHRTLSAIRERINEAVDLNRTRDSNLPAMTPIEVLSKIGISNPSNSQCKECAAVMRELLGESKRINGQNKWRVPLRANYHNSFVASVSPAEEDIY
ncbi:virulence-associated E family protein [Nitrosomonas ureae]|uniref:Putative DNA primase/helicase n=1 Tax=Nitrosomonas ureae TaxID=44577 RepID=A0A1H9G6L0_9PROT|nr:virulence-associated E family protein [Nitrosomonas ureae]SEQ45805.1 putative DNA primase/helicase [Nitrosomonas ureae]